MENINFLDLIKIGTRNSDDKERTIIENCNSVAELKSNKIEIRNAHINIGTGKEVSIKSLAKLVKKSVGFKGNLFFNIDKPDGTLRKLTDVSKLHQLGWHHKIEIEEGIKKMYKWYTN